MWYKIGKTIESWIREHLSREETVNEYYAREKPYIDHALKQEGIPLKFDDVFHD